MVSPKVKQLLHYFIGILAIVAVAKCEMAETSWQRGKEMMSAKRSHYTEDISKEELESFIKCWPEFNKLGLADGIDFSKDKASQKINWKIRFWAAYSRWDAERLFYVHERLRNCLKELKERREALNIINHLQEREDDAAVQMVNLQKKRIKSLKITPNELSMLSSREEELDEMFKQYP